MKFQAINSLAFSTFLLLNSLAIFSHANDQMNLNFQNQILNTSFSGSMEPNQKDATTVAPLLSEMIQSHKIESSLTTLNNEFVLEIMDTSHEKQQNSLKECLFSFKNIEQSKKLVLSCQMNALPTAEDINTFLSTINLKSLPFSSDDSECYPVDKAENSLPFECQFIFSLNMALLKKNRFRRLGNATHTSTPQKQKETKTSLFSFDIDISETTILMVLGAIVIVLILIITLICLYIKKKKKSSRQPHGDTQKLVIKTSGSPPVSLPELTSPTRKLNPKNPHQMFSTDPNTGMSPAHTLKTVPNLKLEDDNRRSSILPEGVLFTNIDDSPDSVGGDSSRMSAKNQPQTLDFHIEFSMVEESRAKMKKNTENRKDDY